MGDWIMRILFVVIVAAVFLPAPASACYSWQVFTCSEAKPESTVQNLVRIKNERRAIVSRGVERLRVREVEQNLAENTRVFVLDIEGAPYRHWLHAGEK